jgi:hypothetical protein
MKETIDFPRLKAELAVDASLLSSLVEKNRRASDRAALAGADEFSWVAVGYTIHNIYCLFENYFLRISKYFENGLDPSSWHAQLVERMTLAIPGIRPALFDRAFSQRIDELRRFRQAFRNLYQTELDPERIRTLNEGIPDLIVDFLSFHARFIAALDLLMKEIS